MALIDKTTNISSFNYNKVGKTNNGENGTFKTNQGDNKRRNTSFPEPPIKTKENKNLIAPLPEDLASGLIRGGLGNALEQTGEVGEQMGDFISSPKGALFTVRQAVLQKKNASEHTRQYKVVSPIETLVHRTARHKESGLFSNPFNEAPRYEDKDTGFYSRFSGSLEEEDLKISKLDRVTPVTLKTVDSKNKDINTKLQKEQKGLKLKTADVKEGNQLNPKIVQDVKDLPKDFINFRIKDMVNNQYIQFPAYITDITDNSAAEYNPTRYIGRPDQVFVYSGYTRNISFGFRVAALKKEDIPILWRKIDKLKLLTLPTFSKQVIANDEQERPIAPFIELTLGNLLYDQPGFFSSVGVTIPQTSTWELDDGFQLPHLCDVTVEFTFVGKTTPQNLKMTHEHEGKGGVHGDFETGKHNLHNPSSYDIGPRK